MPIFESNGKKYNVQDAHIENFKAEHPDATAVLEREGKKFRVKVGDYGKFMQGVSAAPPAPKAEDINPTGDKSGYTFTAEELEIEEPKGEKYTDGNVIKPAEYIEKLKAMAAERAAGDSQSKEIVDAAPENEAELITPVESPKGEPEDLSKYKDILPPVDETYKAALDRALEVDRDAYMKEFGKQDNANYIPVWKDAVHRLEQSEDPVDNKAAEIIKELHSTRVASSPVLDAIEYAYNRTKDAVTAAKDFIVEDVVGRAAGVLTYPIYKTVEGIGDVTGIKAINRFGQEGAKRAVALAENREVNGRSAVEDEFLDARNNILYKNGKDGELTWVGTFLQSTEELAAGFTDPVYRGLDWVGEKTGINLLEETGEAGRANIDEIYENSQYKDNSVVGKFLQLVPQMVGTGVSLMTGNPIAAKASMYAMVGSSMGSAAREAEKEGASPLEQLGTAVFTGLVEFGTERYSLGHWLGKMASKAGNKVFKEAGQEVVEKETEELFKEARKAFGKKITAKTAKEFAKDLLVEGGSEATAEFLQTFTPIIYRDKDKWPTWYEAMQNAWDGAIGGWMMAGPLHLTGSYAQRKANNKRRAEQGYVDAAMITIKDKSGKEKLSIAEIVGEDENHNLIALVDNQPVTVKKEDVKKRQQFSYEEFRNGGMEVYREEGYNATDDVAPQIKRDYDMERERAVATFGEDVVEQLDNDPVGALAGMNEIDRVEAMDYVNARVRYEGIIDRISDDIDERIKTSDKEIDSHANKADGMIHLATMRGVNGGAPRKVYIVSGNVAAFEGGTIDKANSSSMIIVRDAETGEVAAASADDLESLDAVIDTEAEKKTVAEQIANEYAGQQAAIIEGENGKLTYNSNDGVHTVEILGENGDVFTILDNGVERIATREWVDELKAQNGVAVENGEVTAESQTASGGNVSPVETAAPVIDKKARRAELESIIPVKGKKKQFTEVEPAVTAEYISLLTDDVAKQVAAADKYIAMIQEAQEKADPIEALEMDEQIAYWESVKALLQTESEAVPVVEETQTPVVESAPVEDNTPQSQSDSSPTLVEQTTPQATNEMQEADLENAEKGEKGQKAVEPVEENNESTLSQTSDQVVEGGNAPGNGGVYADNQGNPVDADGKLVVDEVNSIDEITDEDFENPTRNVQLPAIPENVANAIGTEGRPVVIKKNVFTKNSETHVELEPEDSRNILSSALYNPNLVGSTQPIKRPDYKVAIRTGEKNAVVVLDVYREKDYVEIVGWRLVNEKGLAKMQRQAEREGGQFLILSPNDGSAAALSALPLGMSSASEGTTQSAKVQENTQKSDETAENGGEKMYSPEELAEAKEQLGELNATSAPAFAARLFSIKPWKTLEEANAVLKELLASYGETLNGQSLAVMPFLDKAQGLISEYNKSQEPSSKEGTAENEAAKQEDKDVAVAIEDELDIYLVEMKAAQERQKAFAQKTPPPSFFVKAYTENDAEAIKKLDKQFYDVLQTLVPMDIPAIEATIKGMKERKRLIKDNENPNYKAFDHIEKALAKRKKQLEKELTEDDKRRLDIIKRGNRGELKETPQPKQENKPVESEPIKDETPITSETTEQPETGEVADAAVNRETLQLNMSEEDFNALLKGGDKTAISEYLAEMDGLLRIGVGSPLDGQVALREEYRKAVEQYGKENIPAEVMDDLNSRMQPYSDLSRAIFDRKYALQDKLREIEANEAQAKEQGDLVSTYIKERKAENKGGFYKIRTQETETKATEQETEEGDVVLYRSAERAGRKINKHAEEFNKTHKGGATVVDIDPNNFEAELTEEGFTAEEIEDVEEMLKKGGEAFYNLERNLIYLFNPNLKGKNLQSMLWHEDTHKAIADLNIEQEVLDEFYGYLSPKSKKSFEALAEKAGYKRDKYAEECVAYCIEGLSQNDMDFDLLAMVTGATEEGLKRQKEIIQPLIDYIENGKQEQNPEGNGRQRNRSVLGEDVLGDEMYDNAAQGAPGKKETATGGLTEEEIAMLEASTGYTREEIIDMFGYDLSREGAGPLTDREVVMESDPYSKVLGKPRYYGKRQREFVARQRRRMAEKARQVAEKLNLNKVEVLESTEGLTGKKATSKGWFDPRTGKITVVVPNHGSTGDIVETVLHEAVAHYGLRKLFGENFNNFLDNVYRNVTPEIRAEINELAKKHGWDFHTATEEYLASLAENTNFEKVNPSLWSNIKSFFMKMLAKVGITLDEPLGDNELRYILWRSHQNLVNPGWFNVFGQAEDIAKQYELGVGNYQTESGSLPSVAEATAPLGQGSSLAAEDEIRFREGQEDETMSFDEIKTAPLTFEEKITQGVLTASALNKKNLDLRQQALREFGRDLTRLLTLMKEQRAYDKSTVDLLVKLSRLYFENAQVLDKMSAYNVKRIMGVLNNAIGKRNITDDANRLLGILMDAHTKELNNLLDAFVKTRATKMNTAGVEIIGSLDKHGQMVLATYKAALEYDANKIDAELLKAENELTDESKVVREEAASRLEGLLLAKEYKDEIKSRREEIAELEREIKDKARQAREGTLDRSAYREFKRATQEAITRSNLELIGAYHDLIQKMSTGIGAASARAREFMKKQLEHVQEIQHDANSDMEGKSADTQGEIPDNWNNSIARIVMGPMVTFQGILKKLGEKSVDGKGYLYNRFMKQITNAGHRLWKKKVGNLLSLNGKLSEIFGREMQYNDLYAIDKKGKGMTITYVENDGPKEIELSQGQMMYLYMINKMSDGAMKLRGMGITESAVLQIEGALMPELKTFADWVQATFLNEKRTEYNEVHERMFGSAMANIEDYFPIKINTKSLTKEEDVALKNVEDKPSTVTGSIIKRTRNAAPVDLSANAIDVLMEHLDKMEQWAAFAETNRDLNSLLSYKRFRNQVLNLKTRRFGSGKKLWDNFRDVCALASRNYTPKTSDVDRAVTNITKGVTASKISFRLFTAMKQLLSAPAFYTETDVKELYKAYKSPKESWDWAIENLPGFAERWQSRQSGNERLKTTDADWDIWKNKYIKGAQRAGMLPNAWIDAVVVSTGARAVYLTKLKQFMAAGYKADAAEAKALQAAAEAYNESQQSSEGAYLSAMQVDRTVISTILTVFKNSNFGYTRKTAQSVANLAKHLKKGNKAQSIEFMAKQMMREGLTEEQARKYADKLWKESILRDSANVAMFGFLLNALWTLGPELIYLFGGDDEEEKEKSWDKVVMGGLLSPVAGLGGGDFVSDVVTAAIDGRWENIELPGLPAFGDMENIYSLVEYDPVRGATELLNMLVSAGVGVNPKTFADMYAAIASTDFANPEELGLFALKFVNAPQGQIDRLMVDKALENGGDNLAAVTAEYMEYKKQYNTPLLGGLYSDEGERKAYERYAKRFKRQINDRLGNVAEDDTAFAMYYEDASPELRSLLTGLREKYIEGDKEPLEPKAVADIAFETLYGKKELNTEYLKLATPDDVDALIELKQKLSELRKFKEALDALPPEQKGEFYEANADALEKYRYLGNALRKISELQKAMTLNKEAGQKILDGIRNIADAASAEITSTENN